MVKIIAIAGKEGEGKTTIALNLSLALKGLKKNVLLIDLNISNPHLSLYVEANPPKTINDFLNNRSSLEEIVYKHPSGLSMIFCSLHAEEIQLRELKQDLKTVFKRYDFIILDCGLGAEFQFAASVSDEVLFVSSPYLASIVETTRQTQLMEEIPESPRLMGLLLNRVKNKNYELTRKEIVAFADIPIIGIIPDDEAALESANQRVPLMIQKPNSKAGKAFTEFATKLAKKI